ALAVFSHRFIRKSRTLGQQTSEIAEHYLAGISDHFNGIKDIKSNRLEDSRYQWLRNWSKSAEQEQLGYAKIKSTSQFSYKMVSIVLIVWLVYVMFSLFQGEEGQLLLI